MTQTLKITLLIITATFLFNVLSVQAAEKYVPTPQQLQPSPPNVQPNLSGNINYIDSDSDSTETEDIQSPGGANEDPGSSGEKTKAPLIQRIIFLPEEKSSAGKVSRWLIVFLMAVGGTWLAKRYYEKK